MPPDATKQETLRTVGEITAMLDQQAMTLKRIEDALLGNMIVTCLVTGLMVLYLKQLGR